MNAVAPFHLQEIEDEPRVLDVDLGAALGMAQPLNIRRTIAANRNELDSYGSIHSPRELIAHGKGGKREVTTYWLNEPQALLLCMFARTPKAAEVRRMLIEAFMQWRRQRLAGQGSPATLQPLYLTRFALLEERIAKLEEVGRPALPPPPMAPAAVVTDRDVYYMNRIVRIVQDYGGSATKSQLWRHFPHYHNCGERIDSWLAALQDAGRLKEARRFRGAMVYSLP